MAADRTLPLIKALTASLAVVMSMLMGSLVVVAWSAGRQAVPDGLVLAGFVVAVSVCVLAGWETGARSSRSGTADRGV